MQPGETTARTNPNETGVPSKLPTAPGIAPEGSELPPALTEPPGVDSLLATLRRRWPMILMTGLGAAVLAFLLVWLIVPGRYSSSIIFRVNPAIQGGESELISYSRSQAMILKDPRILSEVFTLSEVQELPEVQDHSGDPVAWLQSALTVDTPPGQGAEVLRVTLQGEYPEDLVKVLDGLRKVYLQRLETELEIQTRNKEAPILRELENYDLQIRAKRKELAEIQAKLGVGDTKKNDLRISGLNELARENRGVMIREKAELRRLQGELDMIQGQLANPQTIDIPFADIADHMRNDPNLRKQEEVIVEIEGKIAALMRIASPAEFQRSSAQLNNSLEAARARLDAMRQQLRPALESSIRTRRLQELRREEQQTQTKLTKSKAAIEEATNALRIIEQEMNQLNGIVAPADAATAAQLDNIKQDIERLNEKHKETSGQAARIRQEKNAGVRLTVLQEPQIPKERTVDRKLKYGLVAALGSFMVAFMAVALLDFRVRRVNSSRDIAQGLGLPVVGTLPLVPNRDARQLLVMDDSEANHEQLALREAVDGIRTIVLHAGRQQPLQVLLVASALNGEGKTTLASQLASSLARGGRRTLLVDGDLRHPSCHELFNRLSTPGLCEVLRGELPVEDAIQTTEQAQLFLLPAGVCNAKSLQGLAQDVPQTLFGVLRDHFDVIVVDSSPLLPVSDTLQMAAHVDGVLLSIMEERSQLAAVHQAQQRLSSLGVRILGAVVGGTQQGVYLYGPRKRSNTKS